MLCRLSSEQLLQQVETFARYIMTGNPEVQQRLSENKVDLARR